MKIVFTGGGTAGHVTPNIALIEKIDGEAYYVGTDGMEKQLLKPLVDSGKIVEYRQISANKFQRKLTLQNLLLPFKLVYGVKQCKRCLQEIRPDVVFSKGGYVGLPVVIAAKKLGIPSVVHESDLSMGLANKISARYATKLLSTFPCDKRAQQVGLILRSGIADGDAKRGLATMGFDGKRPVVLVMGGSLGALSLNNAVASCPRLAEKFDLFVITGKGKRTDCPFVRQTEYVSNIGDLYAASAVCVTRGGSNSLAELTAANLPFVAVPLTKSSRGEQVKNAEWFSDRKCGVTLNEPLTAEKLFSAVNYVYDNRQYFRTQQRKNAVADGTEKVLEIITQTAKQHKKIR